MLDRITENFDISLTGCLNTYIVTWEVSCSLIILIFDLKTLNCFFLRFWVKYVGRNVVDCKACKRATYAASYMCVATM